MTTKNNPFGTDPTSPTINITFILDTSGTMMGPRIQTLNLGMRDALETIKEMAENDSEFAETKIVIRVIEFNNDADWYLGRVSDGLSPDEALDQWTDITAKSARTNTAAAYRKAAEILNTQYLGARNYMPIFIFITDGLSNNPEETRAEAAKFAKILHGANKKSEERTIRISIGVQDANYDELKDFASVRDLRHEDGTIEHDVPYVYQVDNLVTLADAIRSTTMASISHSIAGGANGDGNYVEDVTDNTSGSDGGETDTDDEWENL